MKSIAKLFLILFLFSVFFFVLRFDGSGVGYNVGIFVADLGGLTYLYSTVATIFAVFAAFVIVSESQDWNTLDGASKGEIRELHEMRLWSSRLSAPLAADFEKALTAYIEIVIQQEWALLEKGQECPEAEAALDVFHELIVKASREDAAIASSLLSSFNAVRERRAVRVEYSWQPLPSILKFTVFLVDISLMFLSLLIGVRNTWLDFIFMLCIVMLGSVILIVVEDLDNPLRPGDWYLSPARYSSLLKDMTRQK